MEIRRTFSALLPLLLVGMVGCGPDEPSTPREAKESPRPRSLEVVFTYGSEKEKWIEAMTEEFHRARPTLANGKAFHITPIAMGSGECVDEVLNRKRETHLISPASSVFISLGNADSQAALGRNLVADTDDLVLSPVVIAMWKPMAEALGWPSSPIGWKEIHEMALDPQGWASRGLPQWGRFRFGHTHPEYSNSGIISLIAETYAAAGKSRDLTLADIENPATGTYLEEIEKAIVHYGRSTGFFGRKMFSTGPEYLSAAVLYENMVIESYEKTDLPFPVVAIYPKEGTFYSDHPIGIVDRDYVTQEHKEAAAQYIEFLLAEEQQVRAMEFGFRPADVTLALSDDFSPAKGVDSQQPQTTLEVPEVPVTKAILDLWHERKKKANVALVLDVSGSMKEEGKMASARNGAVEMISMLGEHDQFSLLAFNQKPIWVQQNLEVGTHREEARQKIQSLFANGGTALYDAISQAHHFLAQGDFSEKITAIVVLSDGSDQNSEMALSPLIEQIRSDGEESGGIRVFTIGYGSGARSDILEQIAGVTQAKYYEGSTANIEKIFKEISTFF